MSKIMTESEVEDACLGMLRDLGYDILYGPDISEGGPAEERKYNEVVLTNRLRDALLRINKSIRQDAIEEAIKKVLRTGSQHRVVNNQDFHKLVTGGIPVQYKRPDGSIKDELVWPFDFQDIGNNEFLAVNQFTVIEERNNRRPDIILFVNGLPLVLIELKNPVDENATIWSAFNQFETYQKEIPSIFRFNEILVVSDGWQARSGTLTSNKERFLPWKTINHKKMPTSVPQIEVLLKGMLSKETLLDLVRHFVVFEVDKDKKDGSLKISKKIAAYQQYNAVNKAIASTVNATKKDKKAGIVWHTQGSGKSLTMVFYAGKMVLEPELENPTIVLLNDRNDLDDQLFGTFGRCQQVLRQEPKQAETRERLKELLKVSSGGIIFTTIQKFFPETGAKEYPLLSTRKNIIIIADEAHRSQYGFGLKIPRNADQALLKYGYAKYVRDALPNATFIGFTGTPIEKADRSTPAVFGQYVDVYDVQQAVEDGSTVRIFYESRLAKLELKPEERPKIDPEFEDITEGQEIESKEHLKSKWSRLEKVVGSKNRISRIANDIVNHWEERLSVLDGKAMIVCMSRRICVDLHNEIARLRPEWYNENDDKGIMKVVMTGSAADGVAWQEHIRNKERRRALGERMKDPSDPLRIALVRDMWLTGFDAQSLHTMYFDKPMRGHTLMQAIARVNRVFKDKPGGLIVDYIGIAYDLKEALAEYSKGDQKETGIPLEEAVAKLHEKFEIVSAFFHGFNYKVFFTAPSKEKMSIMIGAMEHVLKQEKGKERYLEQVGLLSRAFALSIPHEDAIAVRDDVGFFQGVRAAIVKNTDTKTTEREDVDSAIKQILSKAIISDRVIDVFAAAGLGKPDISILSEEFLAEVRDMPQKNLAFEMLKKLLNDEIRIRQRKNLVQARSFEELLDKAIRAYTNKNIEAAEVIEELIELAKKMREEHDRGAKLNLTEDEIAFYDALADNESARQVLGDETLKTMARELVNTIRKNVTIDWTLRDSVQAKLRVLVKRTLRKYGYPPDKQQKATDTVLDQAKLLCKDWAEAA
jgi:type I restriction enzyme R subunit